MRPSRVQSKTRGRPFVVIPGSFRQRLLAAVPYEGSKSSSEIFAELGLTEKNQRIGASTQLQQLAEDGKIEAVGRGKRTGSGGAVPLLYRRLLVPRSRERREFDRAKAIVEAAGFVVIPKRPLPTLAANSNPPPLPEDIAA